MASHLKLIRRALTKAINIGVPLWNSGDYAGCARVYEQVATQFADVSVLASALVKAKDAPSDSSSNSRGWILRRAIDRCLAYIADQVERKVRLHDGRKALTRTVN
jgi:hypothetical protein